MRKGRTQRKTRSSRTPGPPSSLSIGAGVAAPPSSRSLGSLDDDHGHDDMDVLEALAPTPTPEPVVSRSYETTDLPPVVAPVTPASPLVDFAKTLIGLNDDKRDTSLDKQSEPAVPAPSPIAATAKSAVFASSEQEETEDTEEDLPEPASSTAAVVAPIEAVVTEVAAKAKAESESESESDGATEDEAVEAAVVVRSNVVIGSDEAGAAPVAASGDEDLEKEDHEEEFFSQRDLVHAAATADREESWDVGGEMAFKVKRKLAPEVVARREKFGRYVKWAVGGAAVLCLAAVVRSAATPTNSWFKRGGEGVATAAPNVSPVAPVVEKAAATQPAIEAEPAKTAEIDPVPPMPGAAASAKADEAKPADTAATAKADEAAKPADTAATATAKADEAAKPADTAATAPAAAKPDDAKPAATVAAADDKPAKTAAEEKKDCSHLLEGGKFGAAIEAGKRSVALDPEDGEAWLLLGAAYQEKGNLVEAHKAYAACVKEGKRGPKGECAAMLR